MCTFGLSGCRVKPRRPLGPPGLLGSPAEGPSGEGAVRGRGRRRSCGGREGGKAVCPKSALFCVTCGAWTLASSPLLELHRDGGSDGSAHGCDMSG